MIKQRQNYCSQNPDPMCWEKQWVKKIIKTPIPSEPSDGVVPLSRQILEGADRNELVRNSHPSHFAEPNDSGVWGVINEQIDPENAVDDVFKINNCIIN